MANFGPRVFHALARAVDLDDNLTFREATDLSEVGLSDPGPEGEKAKKDLDNFKNALFKLIMLRMRNYTQNLGRTKTEIYQKAKLGIPINVTLWLNDGVLHGHENMAALSGIDLSILQVRSSLFEDPFDGLYSDSKDLIEFIPIQTLACGSNPNLEAIFKQKRRDGVAVVDDAGNPVDDEIWRELWSDPDGG